MYINASVCHRQPTREEELALIGLGGPEIAGKIPEFLAQLRNGLALDVTFERAFGANFELFPELARRGLEQELETRRAAALPWIHTMIAARAEGPAVSLRTADEVLAIHVPSLTRGFALWERARSLEFTGRIEEAERAYDELIAVRRTHPAYHEGALSGKVRCVISAGRLQEADVLLRRILRETTSPQFAEWAQRELSMLPHRARR